MSDLAKVGVLFSLHLLLIAVIGYCVHQETIITELIESQFLSSL